MSKIDSDLVRKIAKLARLELKDEEVSSLTSDLAQIFQYIEKLNEVDISDVEALSHVHGESNFFRDDEARVYENREKILDEAPDRSGNYLRVPLVIDQESH